MEQTSTGAGAELQATIIGTFEVRNIGDKIAPATKLRFFLAEGKIIDGNAALFEEVAVPELAPGKTFTAELKGPLVQGEDAIGLYMIAFVNATKTVEEANKDNNVIPKQIP